MNKDSLIKIRTTFYIFDIFSFSDIFEKDKYSAVC